MDQRKPARAQQPWSEQEDQFLSCPIPATYLAKAALSGRTEESIRWRRRKLGICYHPNYASCFAVISGTSVGRRKEQLKDWPDVDWHLSLGELQRITGLGERTVWRLRREATAALEKPYREGRRGYSCSDFPNVDWNSSTRHIMSNTGLSRPVVYRLKKEFTASLT